MNRDRFSPMPYVSHANEYEAFVKYRVPMWVDGGDYSVNVGYGETRYYVETTLPPHVKVSIAMINAFPFKPLPDWGVDDYNVYVNIQDEALYDIGWRVTQEMYVLVMDRSSLNLMRITK